MIIVFVINLDVGVRRFALPIRHELEWTRLSAGLALHRVLENIDIEVRRSWILLGLSAQQKGECGHIEFECCAHVGRLEFFTEMEIVQSHL